MGFQRERGPRREAQARAGALQERIDGLGREQARRAAAEEHAVHGAAPGQRQVMVQVRQQRLDVLRERWRAAGAAEFVRVEIAVRALAYAPGQVDVERQGRRGEDVDHCRSGFSRELLLRRTRGAEHTYELQSHMSLSYCVFWLKKKNK